MKLKACQRELWNESAAERGRGKGGLLARFAWGGGTRPVSAKKTARNVQRGEKKNPILKFRGSYPAGRPEANGKKGVQTLMGKGRRRRGLS